MPYNKGDFTQQGVAGHVNANLRLNEKRLVNIDMTSNEAAEGCTITGTVKDLLNNKVYGIGSGVSGNIEITENGENINVAPYATATVNVPSSGMDFVIPEQTISTTASGDVSIQTNFPRVLPTYIILQMIGEAYGQTLHGLVVMSHSYGGGVEEYKANLSFGTSVITINVISLDGGTNWGMNVKVDDVQTEFTGILISAISEWTTTPV